MFIWIALTIIVIFLFFKWSTSTYDYFEKRGLPYRKPVPLFGANGNMFWNPKPITDLVQKWYYEFENEKLTGIFEFRRPVVFLRDPEIIKQLTIKDFDYFMDHRSLIPEDMENQLITKTLPVLRGQKWRDMRSTLSPAFTGSKMRQMMEFVSQVGLQTAETMRNDIENGSENSFEFKALASKFTVDIIAGTAFGIEVNTFKNPDNEFFRFAMKVTNFTSIRTGLIFAGYIAIPRIMKALKIDLMDKECCDFFEEAIYENFRTREKLGIVRHDMINLMLEARKGRLAHNNNIEDKVADGFATVEESNVGRGEVKRVWDDADLAAQCFIFFAAGFDSIAQTMSFVAYELACNPEVQQKLYEEIYDMNDETDGKKINYEQLQRMKYLDQVVSETLRKWPAAPMTDRICVKDYELNYDGKKFQFEKNVNFIIPTWSIHRDPKYFPNPEKFDPERFSDENKHSINPDTYLPFGIGPRNCIGSRFALMEVKTIFYYLLLNFSIEVTEKTQIPLKFKKIAFAVKPENGIWVQLKPRNTTF